MRFQHTLPPAQEEDPARRIVGGASWRPGDVDLDAFLRSPSDADPVVDLPGMDLPGRRFFEADLSDAVTDEMTDFGARYMGRSPVSSLGVGS